jgi:hypothetical protein
MTRHLFPFSLALFLFVSPHAQAQEAAGGMKIKNNYGGMLSLGARSVLSTFNDGAWGDLGTGMGGQFMLRFSDRVNTAWFFDYISSGIGRYAHRSDYHIGWSVMYYLVPSSPETTPRWQPYVLAGHCFDYSNLRDNRNDLNFKERWSSAVQAGAGTHYNFTPRFDAALQAQYMIHLGNDVDTEVNGDEVSFNARSGVNLEGHILVTLSLNYKIADLW